VHDATSAAFASFEQKWLDAHPENALVAVFLTVEQRQRERVFNTLVHELEQAAFDTREPQVAAAKLAWWQQELADAAAGNARHPITKMLFSDAQARAVDPAIWPAMAAGATMVMEPGSCATLAESLGAFAPFYAAVAHTEWTLFVGNTGFSAGNATLWTISHLLQVLASTSQAGALLPLDLLARHGVTRLDLTTATQPRAALLRDYLGVLTGEIRKSLAVTSPVSLTRRVRTSLDLFLASKAQRAADPVAYLVAHTPAGRWRSLLTAWREARALARGR
jgi:phytoene synthase